MLGFTMQMKVYKRKERAFFYFYRKDTYRHQTSEALGQPGHTECLAIILVDLAADEFFTWIKVNHLPSAHLVTIIRILVICLAYMQDCFANEFHRMKTNLIPVEPNFDAGKLLW